MTQRWWTRTVGTCAALVVALSLVAPPVLGSVTLELSPPMVELTADPGRETSFEVLVTNASETAPLNLKVSLSPVEERRDGSYGPVEKEGPWSAVPWLQLRTGPLTISPRRSQGVMVKVKIPRGASGTRAAAVVFEVLGATDAPARSQDVMGGSTQFRNQLLTVVKVTANSRANRRIASLTGLSVSGPSTQPGLAAYGKRALKISCSVLNEGNMLLGAAGRLIIRDAGKRRVKEIPLGAGRATVIPGATVDLSSILPQGLPDGDYTAEATIIYGGASPLRATVPFTVANQVVDAEGVRAAVRLAVEPGNIETQLPAGSFRGFNLSLLNLDKAPVTVQAVVRPVVTQAGEFEAVEGPGGPWSAVDWLTLSFERANLQPGERKNLRVNVNVPKETASGSRYAAITLEATKDASEKTSATTTLLAPVIVSVGKDLVKKVTLENPALSVPDPGEPLLVGARVVNLGNTHVAVAGRVVLQRKAAQTSTTSGLEVLGNARMEDVAVLTIPEIGPILPGASTPVIVRYEEQLPPGEYQAVLVVECGAEAPLTIAMPFDIATPAPGPKKSGK